MIADGRLRAERRPVVPAKRLLSHQRRGDGARPAGGHAAGGKLRRGGLILRLLDLDTAARSAALDTDALLWRTTLSEKEDEPLDDGALTLRPKQLLTVRLCCREQENA